MKKTLVCLLVIIVMLVPAIIAVVSYMNVQNAPIDIKTVQTLEMTDLAKKTFSFDVSKEDDKKWIDYFLSLRSKSSKIEELPEALVDSPAFSLEVKTAIKDEIIELYMSTTPSLCYLVDDDGKTYQLKAEDAETFLDSKYAASLYDGATRPTLTVSTDHTILPVETKWVYRTHSSKFVTADSAGATTNTMQNLSINGGLSAVFDIIPDLCNVKVTDNTGFVLFEDIADNLPNLKVDTATDVQVELTAKWYEESGRDYYGESKYVFNATLTAPATFYVLENEMDPGEFIALSAKNVTDVSAITFKCEPDVGFTPRFFTEGDYAYAFFHVPLGTEPGEYKLTLACGNTLLETTVNVVARSYGEKNITVNDAVISGGYSDEAKAEFDALVKSLTANVTEKRLFSGAFEVYPYGYPYSIGMPYGREVTLNGNTSTTHFNMGIQHKPNYEGSPVSALNDGTVVYVGNTAFAGNMVVIDHGFGLMTWYRNMGEPTVTVGQSVTKGEKLGVTGDTGFAYAYGVNISMSIGEHFVCYYDTSSVETEGEGGIFMKGIHEPAESK